jgi:hypothetical protein
MADTSTFTLADIEPIDHQGVIASPAELVGLDEQDEAAAPERSAAGKEAGYPLAAMFVSMNVIISARLFPDAPLSTAERKELESAAAEVEAYYAPDLSGPWWVWARLAMTTGAIYGPRVAERRSRARQEQTAAAPLVQLDAQAEPTDNTSDPEVRL